MESKLVTKGEKRFSKYRKKRYGMKIKGKSSQILRQKAEEKREKIRDGNSES